jgi:hypothetical protein
MKRRELVLSAVMFPVVGRTQTSLVSGAFHALESMDKLCDAAKHLGNILLTANNAAGFIRHLDNARGNGLVRPPSSTATPSFHQTYQATHFVYSDWAKPTECTRTFGVKGGPIVHVEPQYDHTLSDLNGAEMREVCSPSATNRFGCVPWTTQSRQAPDLSSHKDLLLSAMARENLDGKYFWHYTRPFVVGANGTGLAMAIAHESDPSKNRLIFA